VARGRAPAQAAALLRRIVTGAGVFVPGLPGGLTHTFPEPAALTPAALAAAGLVEDGSGPARGEAGLSAGEADTIELLAGEARRGATREPTGRSPGEKPPPPA